MAHILIIDGSNITHSSFHAMSQLSHQGTKIGGVYGLIKLVLEPPKNLNIDSLVVVFDSGTKCFRHDIYAEYKSHRKIIDEDLIQNLELIYVLLHHLDIRTYMLENEEADDVIATLSMNWSSQGHKITIFSKDKDFQQLVSENIQILNKEKGHDKLITHLNFKKHFDLNQNQFRDFLAICGDSSDNVQGVRGVGPVTAVKLLKEYGSIENIYRNLNNLSSSLAKKFIESEQLLELSIKLVTLKTNIPSLKDEQPLLVSQPNYPAVISKFKEIGFFSLLNHLNKKLKLEDADYFKEIIISDADVLAEVIHKIQGQDISLYYHETLLYFYCIEHKNVELEEDTIYKIDVSNQNYVENIINAIGRVYTCDYKNQLKVINVLPKALNIWEDICLLSYLKFSYAMPHNLENIVNIYGYSPFTSLAQGVKQIYKVFQKILNELNDEERQLYHLEKKLLILLHQMEKKGILVDPELIKVKAKEIENELIQLKEECLQKLGEQVNLSSPIQVIAVLKRHPQFDKALITKYRHLLKIYNTFTLNLLSFLDVNSRLHTTFNQVNTLTGRLSSSHPNMQNLPRGHEIRQCFITHHEYHLISLDYSQIELRIAAHLSSDNNLISAFLEDIDIHHATASRIFKKDIINKEERHIAKIVNFGVLYGIGPLGLSKIVSIGIKECTQIIEDFFASYSGLASYLNSLKMFARENGFVQTLKGRKIYLPHINSKISHLQKAAERNAINSPIQGSVAEIIKFSMLEMDGYIKKHKLDANIILQIHDELVLEIHDNAIIQLDSFISIMENILSLKVPLKVNMSPRWS